MCSKTAPASRPGLYNVDLNTILGLCVILGMENMVGLFAAPCAQIVCIDLLHNGVVMALPQLLSLVLIIEGLGTKAPVVHKVLYACRNIGLSAAVDTAAGAAHDLHKVILLLALPNGVQQLTRILGAGNNGNAHRLTGSS